MKEELTHRIGKYVLNKAELNFLFDFNNYIEPFDLNLYDDVDEDLPIIWIVGLPRTGTTLITELMCNCLDVGYINNLIARFWKAPLTGIKLSKMILGESRIIDYTSDYGKSNRITGPHEFSYFWQKWLRVDNFANYKPESASESIDWNSLRQLINNMSSLFQKPMVFKGMEFIAFHCENFRRYFPKSLFIYIERDVMDVACSIAQARLDYYGSLDTWWSAYPLEYPELVDLSYGDQIAGQVYYLSRCYEGILENISDDQFIRITYEKLCEQPQKFLDDVKQKIEIISGIKIEQINSAPDSFQARKRTINKEIRENILRGFRRYGIQCQ